jgi:hypothetical protein
MNWRIVGWFSKGGLLINNVIFYRSYIYLKYKIAWHNLRTSQLLSINIVRIFSELITSSFFTRKVWNVLIRHTFNKTSADTFSLLYESAVFFHLWVIAENLEDTQNPRHVSFVSPRLILAMPNVNELLGF